MKKSLGFTLLEMLLVVAIIAILVAISLPVFTAQLNRASEMACLANRRSLFAVISADYILGEYPSQEAAFHGLYDAKPEDYPCSSGGIYSWSSAESGGGHILCSVHDDSIGGGGDGGGNPTAPTVPTVPTVPAEPDRPTFGGTDLPVNNSYWPTPDQFPESWSSISITAGGVFQHTDGQYYVVNQTTSVTKSQAASGPGGDLYSWYATQRLTGRTVVYAGELEQKSDLQRGDLCKVGNDYYVYIDGGSWAYGPTVNPASLYKIPG